MILALVILLAVAVRAGARGSLRGIGQLSLRGEVPLVMLFVLLLVARSLLGLLHLPPASVLAVWLTLMISILGLCAMNVRSVRGFAPLTLGVLLNAVVVARNGGMPVSAVAVSRLTSVAGTSTALPRSDLFHLPSAAARMMLLGDTIPLEAPALRAVLSVGDVLMFVGIVIVLVATPLSRPNVQSPG